VAKSIAPKEEHVPIMRALNRNNHFVCELAELLCLLTLKVVELGGLVFKLLSHRKGGGGRSRGYFLGGETCSYYERHLNDRELAELLCLKFALKVLELGGLAFKLLSNRKGVGEGAEGIF
jgi:hypothetical protein